MLYDPTRKAITVVVGIKSVTENDSEPDYSWTNKFAEGTLRILKCPINLSENELVFDGFNKGQSPFRNITHEQYRKLMGQRFDTESG